MATCRPHETPPYPSGIQYDADALFTFLQTSGRRLQLPLDHTLECEAFGCSLAYDSATGLRVREPILKTLEAGATVAPVTTPRYTALMDTLKKLCDKGLSPELSLTGGVTVATTVMPMALFFKGFRTQHTGTLQLLERVDAFLTAYVASALQAGVRQFCYADPIMRPDLLGDAVYHGLIDAFFIPLLSAWYDLGDSFTLTLCPQFSKAIARERLEPFSKRISITETCCVRPQSL